MKTVILAGGLGTRMREETEFKPKPMVNIGPYPIIWHIMKIYSSFNYNDFIVCAGYKGEQIKEYFSKFDILNSDFTVKIGQSKSIKTYDESTSVEWNVTVANTGNSAKTGGRLLQIKKYLLNETFMCTYGDGLSNINIKALVDFHNSHGKIATVTCIHPNSRFGKLKIGENGLVSNFEEKPSSLDWVNGGFFIFNSEIFNYLDGDVSLEEDTLFKLVKDSQLMAFRHDGFWQSMDTYREVLQLNEIWESGSVPWKIWK